MKDLAEATREITVSGAQEVATMRVADNGEVLKAFITSIYSQKEKTVVRELMANAFDAMAAVGKKDQDIEVYLPTPLEPSFVVRDFGEGMTHDFVMQLYTQLGHSTKRDTNEQTGMFGIGSKSPLSITDTFTLRCFDKPGWNGAPHMVGDLDLNELGRIRLYTVFVDENHVPRIGHTFDVLPRAEDRIELGGCEVKVPIGPDRRRAVLEGVASQHYSWFDKPVKFDGALDEVQSSFYKTILNLAENLYLATKTDETKRYSSSSTGWALFVRQGASVYPVTQSQVAEHVDDSILSVIRNLSGNGSDRHVMVDIPIGTIKATLAREELQYTPEGLKNLCAVLTDTFGGYREILAKGIGDARSYTQAMTNLAKVVLDKPEDRESLTKLRFVSSLLPLVKDTIRSNYDAWYDKLPDVKKSMPKEDPTTGLHVRDANGMTVYEMKDVRPKRYTPEPSISLSNADFPEGKVLLHAGTMFKQYDEVRLNTDSVSSSISFKAPTICYIIPSHLRKWDERLLKHARETFKADDLPESGDPIKVAVIRCSKRNIDGVLETLKACGVYYKHYGMDEMPDIEVTLTESRAYSKTSVHQWTGTAWSDSKVEPDYLKPAYYMTRVGIAHEVYAKHPIEVWDKQPMLRGKLSNYDIGNMIRGARQHGFLTDSIPIYRVTERQSEIIAKSAPDWIHLPTMIAKTILAQPDGSEFRAFTQSELNGSSGEYYLGEMLSVLLRNATYYSEHDKTLFSWIYEIAKLDPVFKTTLACRWKDSTVRSSFSNMADKYSDLRGLLFGAHYARSGLTGTVDSTPYNAVYSMFRGRYNFFIRMLNLADRSARPTKEEIKHFGYYAESFLAELRQETFHAPVNVSLITPLVAEFEAALDKAHADAYRPRELAEDTIINEEAA